MRGRRGWGDHAARPQRKGTDRPKRRLTAVFAATVMGGLWFDPVYYSGSQGPPITDLELPHRVRYQAGLYRKPGCRLSARPKGRPPLQPSRPALRRGRVLAGTGASMRDGMGTGDKFFGRRSEMPWDRGIDPSWLAGFDPFSVAAKKRIVARKRSFGPRLGK